MSTSVSKRPLQRRRQPLQQRSVERDGQILDITARLLEDTGLDDLTTILIARESGMSVGTLYHYFPNKHAILYALGERWLAAISSCLQRVSAETPSGEDADTFAGRLVERLLDVYRAQQGLLPLAQAMFAIPELRELDARHDQIVIDHFTRLFVSLGIRASEGERNRIARALFELCHALLLVVVNQNAVRGRRTLADLKRLATCLLAPYCASD